MDPNQHREFASRGLTSVIPLPRHRVGRHHIFRIGVVTSDVLTMLDYALAADFDLFAQLLGTKWLCIWCADREILARAEAAIQPQKDTTRTDAAPFTPSCPTAEYVFLPVSGTTSPSALLTRFVSEVQAAFDAEISARTPQSAIANVQPAAAPMPSAPATADVRITIRIEQEQVRVQVREDRGPILAPTPSVPQAAPAVSTPPAAQPVWYPTTAPSATPKPAPLLVRFTPPAAPPVVAEEVEDASDDAEEVQDDGRTEAEEDVAEHSETQPIPAVAIPAPLLASKQVEPKGDWIKTPNGGLAWRCKCGLSFEGNAAVTKHKRVPHTACPGCNGVVPEERLPMHQVEPHFLCGECGAAVLLENRTRHLQTRCGARP